MRRLLCVALTLTLSAFGQQPQTHLAPTFDVNAKYANGVAPGYAPTAGTGLVLNVSAGTAFCSGSVFTYAGSTLTMTASTTNYVYLNTASSCVPAVKTTTFASTDLPVATVVTSSSAITTITDVRTHFSYGASVLAAQMPALTGDCTTTAGAVATTCTKTNGTAFGSYATLTSVTPVQVTLPTTAIAANACTTAATVTMTGVAASGINSTFTTAFATSPVAVVGWGATGGLVFEAWPTANTLNWSVCNQAASSITPGAMTLNVGAK